MIHAPLSDRDHTLAVLSSLGLILFVGLAAYWLAGHATISWLLGDGGPGLLRSLRQYGPEYTLGYFLFYADTIGFVVFPLCVVSCFLLFLLSEGRIPARAVFLSFLAAGLGVRIFIALHDAIALQSWPLIDDSYYYFNIARNLATDGAVRHDSFNLTTGFQPLFLLLITPIYALVHDRNAAINAVLVLQSGIGALFCILLYKICSLITSEAIAIFACLIWAFSPYCILTDLNGMETSTGLVLVAALVYLYRRDFLGHDGPLSFGRYGLLGCVLGLGFLARIDLILFVPALAVDQLLRRFRSEGKGLIGKLAVTGAAWGIIASPWLVYVMKTERAILPSSGAAVRYLSLATAYRYRSFGEPGWDSSAFFDVQHVPLAYYARSFEKACSAILWICDHTLPLWLGALLVIGGFLVSFRAQRVELGRWRFFVFFGAILTSAYSVYIFGQGFYYRYFASFLIVYVAFAVLGASSVYRSRFLLRFPRLRRYGGVTILTGIAGILMAASAIRVVRVHMRTKPTEHYDATQWINENTPREAVIGAFQSGILGYYLDRRFYGLDGKINGEALKAMKKNRIDLYVSEKKISYLADWPWIIDALFVRHAQVPDPLHSWEIIHEGPFRVYRALDGSVAHPGGPHEVEIRH